MSAPDLIFPVVGWRVWSVRPEGIASDTGTQEWGLASLAYHNVRWPVRRQLTASCLYATPRNTGNAAPEAKCTCGVHAYKSLEMAEMYLRTASIANAWGWPLAYGSVNLWGRVIECENGYRAEHAYPQMIFFDRIEPPIGALDQYGVEILPFDKKQADVRAGNAFRLQDAKRRAIAPDNAR